MKDMKTIVVIEDDENILRFIRVNLNVEGHVVIGTRSARQGLEAAIETRPDLIILDVILPELSGWELLAQISSHRVLHSTPILILTDTENVDEEMRARRMGATDYVVRPVSANELVRHVRRLLEVNPPSTSKTEDLSE